MSKIKIGVFGAWRGSSYIDIMSADSDFEIIAVCDKNAECLENKDPEIRVFTDFDSFLAYGREAGMNAVFLANYFHQHTPFAIKALNAGMDVLSECTASSTLAECVELCEAVEKTGRKYMLCENYPFSDEMVKMNEIISGGSLGTLLYAEGEYNHSENNEGLRRLTPDPYHWRAWMPRTYYITHSLGPVMYLTKSEVRYVSARAAHSDLLYKIKDWRHNFDGMAMMLCEMTGGLTARVTGCTAMASDYSRYRVCGDVSSVEYGEYIPGGKVRQFYFNHTKPEGLESNIIMHESTPLSGGNSSGHGGGDYRTVQNIKAYLLGGEKPFLMFIAR